MHYAITIAYDGSRYDGWQRQGRTENTIQGKIEGVLSRLKNRAVTINGAGRTDAGVHALAQVATFDLGDDIAPDEILNYCARYLPEDIGVTDVRRVPPRFHARLSAKGKVYRYVINLSPVSDVFHRKYQYHFPAALNVSAMREAASMLLGTHDFIAFSSLKRTNKSTVRTLSSIQIEQRGALLEITFVGDGFLYNMVRILTGTLLEVGLGEREAGDMPEILASLDRTNAGKTAPARGLTLVQVLYDGDGFP